jgi:hypothetical protein
VAVAAAGRQFAGYALVVLAQRARLLVHELGHICIGGSPHCGYHSQLLDREDSGDLHLLTGAPRWRSCFDVASYAFLARVQAENGLPVEPYIASIAISSPPASDSPDFGTFRESGTRTARLDRPFWVRSSVGFDSCERVPSGAEYINTRVTRLIEDPSSAPICVGRSSWTLSAIGLYGGGLVFSTSNGCSCRVPSVVTTGTGGSVLAGFEPGSSSAACADSIAYRRGVYAVPRT